MSGRSWIEAKAEQREELRGLAGSSDREEADRARGVFRMKLALIFIPD
jgi:hypothetical protein